MRLADLEQIFAALNGAGVRYLVVGGLAVNAHGYQRLTLDVDMVIELAPANIESALSALAALDYAPVVPVPLSDFADEEKRRHWREDKSAEVLSLQSPRFPGLALDLFNREPFEFNAAYRRAMVAEMEPGLSVPFAAIEDLITMKRAAGRPRDIDDIEHLRQILEGLGHG